MKCIIIDNSPIVLNTIESYLNSVGNIELVGKFYNPLDAITILDKNIIDVIFLDIEMYYLNRIDLIKNRGHFYQFIFTSKHSKYNIKAFKLNAIDYLIKPILFDNFLRAVSKAKKVHNQEQGLFVNISSAGQRFYSENKENITIKTEKGNTVIDVSQIIYIQNVKGFNKIYILKNRIPIISSLSTENILVNLPDYFLQVHNLYIINSSLINAVQKRKVIIENMHIPLGEPYHIKVIERLSL